MARTTPKLWLSTSRIRIINIVSFLMLSAVAVANEANSTRQCYWCGPIAEQVHRSEVAPPCGQQNSVVFNCQEDHYYCAIAASSPPYVESRFCSKVYQDECYPQYCNSTKKWRMTCTCRGDLCNENITRRETDAFAKLPRAFESRESRDKRETKNANLLDLSEEKTAILTNPFSGQGNNVELSSTEDDGQNTELIISDPKINVHTIANDEEIAKNTRTPSDSAESAETKDIMTYNGSSNNYEGNDDVEKVHKIKADYRNEFTATSIKAVLLSKVIVGTTKMTKPNEDVINTNTLKPSEKLPSAEALQQDASSENDHDNTEHTTVDYEPTEAATSDGDDGDDHVTTEPSQPGENSAHINNVDIILLLNGILLHLVYNRK